MIKDIDNIDPKLLEEDERIVSFLKGQMSAEEENKFMTELNENPELKENAIITARLVKGLKEVGSLHDQDIIGAFLASSEQSVDSVAKDALRLRIESAAYALSENDMHQTEVTEDRPEANNAKVISMRRTAKWLSIAASLFVVAWLGIEYSMYRTTTGLGEKFGNEFSSSAVIRGAEGQSAASKKLDKLFGDVRNNRNLDDAIHELSLCWELSLMETYNDYTDFSPEIGWNLAIAHLKNNDKTSAKKVLEKLVENTDKSSAVNLKAKELLSKIY